MRFSLVLAHPDPAPRLEPVEANPQKKDPLGAERRALPE